MDNQNTGFKSKTKKPRTQDVSYKLYKEGLTIPEIASKRGFTESTIYTHLIQLHEEGKPIPLNDYISQNEVEVILDAKEATGENEKSIKPVFEHLKEKVPYWKIRLGLYLGYQL